MTPFYMAMARSGNARKLYVQVWLICLLPVSYTHLQYVCVQVVEESVGHETLRPIWKQLMSKRERGDELVMAKFSNAVRGLRELAALIELCRIKVVRIISIHRCV